jgi:hypothetical protein
MTFSLAAPNNNIKVVSVFQEIFENTSKSSLQNLPQVLLWQEAEREFQIHFDNYYTQFIKNTQMSEENIQVFRKNFPHFFLKNT